MMKVILTGIFVFIFIIVFCASIDCLFDLFKRISQFIEKIKRKKIIKKLKEMPTLVFCASIDCLFDLFKRISQFIEKRKRKKIIKKLK